MWVMRKRFRVLLLAAVAAAFMVPVGFALSLDPAPRTRASASNAAGVVPVMLVVSNSSLSALLDPIPDSAKLLLAGTTLFGLAAAVRKTS
jgi:hypothetical protein